MGRNAICCPTLRGVGDGWRSRRCGSPVGCGYLIVTLPRSPGSSAHLAASVMSPRYSPRSPLFSSSLLPRSSAHPARLLKVVNHQPFYPKPSSTTTSRSSCLPSIYSGDRLGMRPKGAMRLARLCVIATPDGLDSGGVLGSTYLALRPSSRRCGRWRLLPPSSL